MNARTCCARMLYQHDIGRGPFCAGVEQGGEGSVGGGDAAEDGRRIEPVWTPIFVITGAAKSLWAVLAKAALRPTPCLTLADIAEEEGPRRRQGP